MLAACISGALALSTSAAPNRRELSYTGILNYNPGSKVTDHASARARSNALLLIANCFLASV